MSHSKIRVLVHSNHSRLVTGFGKNMKNILLALYKDPEIELIEAGNGQRIDSDLLTPWESYGTYPSDPKILSQIQENQSRNRVAQYGYYCIDEIIEKVKPDVYIGIEDIWAFREFEKKDWWKKTNTIIWTTLDSLPILDLAEEVYSSCDKMLVWASFAEREMKKLGCPKVETLHGAVDYSHFRPLKNRKELRARFGLSDDYVIGFVFKNQLRKSVPNLLDGFKKFKEQNKDSKAKLLLHTDWSEKNSGWDIEKYIKEKGIKNEEILSTYVCHACDSYSVAPYKGEDLDCKSCGSPKSLKTKTSQKGVGEQELNEIYNLMDVYCHPFTSGGQELPIQEAKAAGLITLVTNYSCGEDSCNEEQGGLPLSWSEYREPSTNFIKASTDPDSISEQLCKVYKMSEKEKNILISNGKRNIIEKFSVDKTTSKLKKIIKECLDNGDKKNKSENKESLQKEREKEERLTIKDILDDEGPENRILIVMPENGSSVLMINSLLKNIKKTYPEKNIYLSIDMSLQCLVNDNENLHKVIPYTKSFDNSLALEGRMQDAGYFDIVFLPNITTHKTLSYIHNGKDKIQFFK